MKRCVAILVVAVLANGASAVVVMSEDFESDPTPRGWIADGPAWHATGGVGDSGFYSGTRTTFYPWVGIAAGGADLTATTGTLFDVTIDAKWISGNSAGISWDILSSGTTWKYDFNIVPPTTWTTYAATIDATMSDGDAVTAGWTRTTGSGSFSGMWLAADWLLFTQVVGGGAGGSISIGVDNFEVDAVPEPATVGLVVSGLAGLALRRRRRA